MSSEADQTLMRAKVFVQGLMVHALIATHPDPAFLQRVFEDQLEQLVANLLAGPSDEAFLGALGHHRDLMRKHLRAATERQRQQRPTDGTPF